jgi:lysozyme
MLLRNVPSRFPARVPVLLLLLGWLAACAAPQQTATDPTPDDFPVHGIDVSKYQGQIDWHAVRHSGVAFVFMKATEGGDHLDSRFFENWEGARRAGIPRGAYHFVWWCRPPTEQMDWFVRHVPNDPDALPPVLDVEWNPYSKNCQRRVPRAEALAWMRYMLQAMERTYGKRPIIYADINFHKDVMVGEFNDYPVWVRSVRAYPARRYENRRWTFWQYTEKGTVPGITGPVDRNTFYGSVAEWRRFLATNCDPRDHHRLHGRGLCGEK